jgi:hypothetical protein
MTFNGNPAELRAVLAALAEVYQLSLRRLVDVKNEFFTHGAPVFVNSPRFTGYGVVLTPGDPRDAYLCPETVTVFLENGNSWWYPVQDCCPVPWTEVPPDVRRSWLFRLGYRGMYSSTRGPIGVLP